MRRLSSIESAFEIIGRGCVISLVIGDDWPRDAVVSKGDLIELHQPDGSIRAAQVLELAHICRNDGKPCVGILLPPEMKKADVAGSTEVWVA